MFVKPAKMQQYRQNSRLTPTVYLLVGVSQHLNAAASKAIMLTATVAMTRN